MINENQLILKQNPENTLSQTLKNSFTTWISPECNFEELRNKAQYKDMVQLSKDNISLLTSLCSHRETPKLRKSISFGMVVLSYFERSLQKEDEDVALFYVGKLMGCVETLDRLQFAGDQNQMAVERAKLFGTKHLDEVILSLWTHGSMSQTALRKSLNLRPSTLSEVLKKVRKTQLVQVVPYGKSKLYSLSDTGIQYGRMLLSKGDSSSLLKSVPNYYINIIMYSNTPINNDQDPHLVYPQVLASIMFDDSSLPNRSPSLPFSLSNSYEPLPSEPNDMQHNHHPINLSMEVSAK